MKTIFLFFILIISSCSVNKELKTDKKNTQLLKQLAYCKCIEHSMETFSKIDSSETGSSEVKMIMDYEGLFTNIVDPICNSLAFTVVKRQMTNKYDSAGKAESARGKASYILDCLNSYNSKD